MMNNVDLRTGFKLGDQTVALVTASNRADNSIAIYRVNAETRMLENVASRKIVTVTAYGSCMYRSPSTGKFYYFVTAKSGDIEQWELIANGGGRVDALKVRGFKVGSQIEGCVVDDELGHLYVGEEMGSIWKYGAEPGAGTNRTEVDKAGAGRLVADIEGLAIAYEEGGKGYLVVSSQGNNSFVVYRRDGNNEFVKSFKIVAGNGIDSVEETDGLDVTTANLGPAFPRGVIVVQDGINDKGYQNFKLVPLHFVIDRP
jgi:3-phytase